MKKIKLFSIIEVIPTPDKVGKVKKQRTEVHESINFIAIISNSVHFKPSVNLQVKQLSYST